MQLLKKKIKTENVKVNKDYIRCVDLKKMTTTKKILWLCWLVFLALILLKLFNFDVETPLTIVGGVLTSIVTGFYMWKSKCENREKIALSMVDELAEKYGIENVISLIAEILKE